VPRSQIRQFQLRKTPHLHLPHIHCTSLPLMSQMSNTSTYHRSSLKHTMKGLLESHAHRPYDHRTRTNKKYEGLHILGVSKADKVTLITVSEEKN
jgi:hypothetical protein